MDALSPRAKKAILLKLIKVSEVMSDSPVVYAELMLPP